MCRIGSVGPHALGLVQWRAEGCKAAVLEHGADVEAKGYYGKTALQFAVDRGRDDILRLLREHGAK